MRLFLFATFVLALLCRDAHAWGDDGHKVVALIAQKCLTPSTKKQVTAMLRSDTDDLTKHDIASSATWADKYRDFNHRKDHYTHTQNWHFVDIEVDSPDLNAACFGHPPLPGGQPASDGPDKICATDKINQFGAELRASDTDAEERVMALKFILHFVGDIHQPLHSSDNHDRGGNDVKVIVDGFPHKSKDELHGFLDTQFVDALGTPPSSLVASLLSNITPAQAKEWATGMPEDWAKEAFAVSLADVYGNPPLSKGEVQHLDSSYVNKVEKDVKLQLSRAGVRLAFFLNQALDTEQADWDSCLGGITQPRHVASAKKGRQRHH
jgi:S1/P1 Nuclease